MKNKNKYTPGRQSLFWQIYPAFLAVVALAVLITGIFSARLFKNELINHTKRELFIAATTIREILYNSPFDRSYLDEECKDLGRKTGVRITYIALNGTVLCDSEKDPATMDNHADRPEFKAALETGTGTSIRYSHTLEKDMMYFALALRNPAKGHPEGVLRTSVPLASIKIVLQKRYGELLYTGLLVVLIAAVVSFVTVKALTRPLEKLREGAERLASGNFNYRIQPEGTRELYRVAEALNQMALQINKHIETISQRQKELEAIFNNMAEGLLLINGNGEIVQINKTLCKMIGSRSSEIKNISQIPSLINIYENTMNSGKCVEDEIIFTAGKEETHVRVRSVLIEEGGGERGVLMVLSDITRLKQLEEIRRQFVANVSHELKTPLTAIKGCIETIQNEESSAPLSASKTFLDIIAKNADRMHAIIEDLLTLARIEQQEQTKRLDIQSCHLARILNSAVESAMPGAREKNILLHVDCEKGLAAELNASLMEQAVFNLVDNAVKYSEEGTRVEIKACRDNNDIVIQVIDEGPGIPPEHLPHIFERFYRVDKSRSRKLGGTGLGLSIVKHIAQLHGGRVEVKSTPGKGTTFTIRIPVQHKNLI